LNEVDIGELSTELTPKLLHEEPFRSGVK